MREDARQAGVELGFTTCGTDWLLKLNGLPSPMPTVLLQALKTLANPLSRSGWNRQTSVQSPHRTPIRQLLKTFSEQPQPDSPAGDPQALQALWANARWHGPGHWRLPTTARKHDQNRCNKCRAQPGSLCQPQAFDTGQRSGRT
ncbi:MAG: hypothetical protein MUW57_05730 [Pseudomonas sp.]|nr:hypothetical protein [Pseudomonas sp.]